jgi:hypothetical protein
LKDTNINKGGKGYTTKHTGPLEKRGEGRNKKHKRDKREREKGGGKGGERRGWEKIIFLCGSKQKYKDTYNQGRISIPPSIKTNPIKPSKKISKEMK